MEGIEEVTSATKTMSAPAATPSAEGDRVRVFLKVHANKSANSAGSCISCDPQGHSAWPLDFDGEQSGNAVKLDGVYSSDQTETALHAKVIEELVNEFIAAPRVSHF